MILMLINVTHSVHNAHATDVFWNLASSRYLLWPTTPRPMLMFWVLPIVSVCKLLVPSGYLFVGVLMCLLTLFKPGFHCRWFSGIGIPWEQELLILCPHWNGVRWMAKWYRKFWACSAHERNRAQVPLFSKQKVLRMPPTSWLAHSTCPFDWGWYPDMRITIKLKTMIKCR